MFDQILVPTDGSECAAAAVDYAADLARRYGATLRALSVVESRRVESGPHYDECREEAEAITAAAAERVGEGVAIDRAVRTGVPAEAILEDATEADVDLIAIGTHGRTGVDRYLLGSVAETRCAAPTRRC